MRDLAAMADGARNLVATGSPSFRRLSRDPGDFDEAELVDLIVAQPRLLRRPLAVVNGRLLIGSRAVAAARPGAP